MESDSWSACSWYWPHGFSRPSICEDRHHQIIWTAGLGSSFGVPRHHMDGSAVQQLGVHVWLSAWIFSSEIKVISTAFQTHWLSCLHKKKWGVEERLIVRGIAVKAGMKQQKSAKCLLNPACMIEAILIIHPWSWEIGLRAGCVTCQCLRYSVDVQMLTRSNYRVYDKRTHTHCKYRTTRTPPQVSFLRCT